MLVLLKIWYWEEAETRRSQLYFHTVWTLSSSQICKAGPQLIFSDKRFMKEKKCVTSCLKLQINVKFSFRWEKKKHIYLFSTNRNTLVWHFSYVKCCCIFLFRKLRQYLWSTFNFLQSKINVLRKFARKKKNLTYFAQNILFNYCIKKIAIQHLAKAHLPFPRLLKPYTAECLHNLPNVSFYTLSLIWLIWVWVSGHWISPGFA